MKIVLQADSDREEAADQIDIAISLIESFKTWAQYECLNMGELDDAIAALQSARASLKKTYIL